jgi:peptidyl-prolyl cis-trans isomerase C
VTSIFRRIKVNTWNRYLVLSIVAALVGCGGGNDRAASGGPGSAPGGVGQDFSGVIARVGDLEITQAYFDYRYGMLSPTEKERFSGEQWKQRFLDWLVEQALVYKAAEDGKYELLPEVDMRLETARRSILFKAYYDRKFKEELVPSDEEIQRYYDDHPDEFRLLGRALGYHIQTASKDKIDQAYKELEDGATFAQAAAKYSEDENSRSNDGLLGWFNRDGYVLGLGFEKEFTDKAFSMEPGTYSEPFQLGDNWHILKLGAKTEDTIQPLEEVRDRIIQKIRPVIAKEQYEQHLDDLKKKYGVRRFGEYQEDDVRTAEQLYRLGAESRNNYAKLHYYETLVKQYPDDDRADDALFMVGFINSEEFGDAAAAAAAFRRLMRDWPKSEYVDECEWMLKNLGRKEPELRANNPPQDPDAVKERIESIRD